MRRGGGYASISVPCPLSPPLGERVSRVSRESPVRIAQRSSFGEDLEMVLNRIALHVQEAIRGRPRVGNLFRGTPGCFLFIWGYRGRHCFDRPGDRAVA